MRKNLREGWTTVSSSDFCIRVADGTHDTPKPVSDGRLLVTSKNLREGRVDPVGAYMISEADYQQINKRSKVDRWDVLFSMIGTVGEIALVREEPDFAIKNIGLFKNRNEEDGTWLYYYLKSSIGQAALDTFLSGTSQQFVALGDLRKVQVIVPTDCSKVKVCAILSAYDELIENNRRRIALLEKLAEEIYREWFVRLRFPGHKTARVIKGVPQGWSLVKLEQAFQFTGGGTPTKEVARYWDGGELNWFTPSDITGADGMFLTDSGERCTEEGYNNSSAKLFPPYSVMLTSRATIGAIGINTTPACTNQGFITCLPNERYPLPYLYHWLKLAKPHFELLSGGATFAELTKGTFKRIEILSPPEPIVEEFAKIEAPMFKSIETLLAANRKLTETRDKLLPRLISGKLSVENLDIQFPPGMAEEATAAS